MSTQVRFTLAEYHRMIDAAVFDSDRRIELLFGDLHEMSPIGDRHRRVVVSLTEWASDRTAGLRQQLAVQVQSPIRLAAQRSNPLPDMSWIDRQSMEASAKQDKVFLVIEVADSTLALDRGKKARLYAKAGIPDYWIINLVDDCLEMHRNPEAGRYRSKTIHRADDEVKPLLFPECSFKLRRVFG